MSWELFWAGLGGVGQVVTIAYFIYQFNYLPRQERKEMLKNYRVMWKLSKTKPEKPLHELIVYYEENNCKNSPFLPGISFRAQVLQLVHLQQNDLADEVLNGSEGLLTSKELIVTATNSLSEQIKSFTNLEAHFNTVFKFKDVHY